MDLVSTRTGHGGDAGSRPDGPVAAGSQFGRLTPMTADDVLDVLDALEADGVRFWLDGGWGIDALLGRQTREHADLDLAVDAADLATATEVLAGRGFSTVRDWLPMSLAVRDAQGREVDLHRVEMTSDGGGDQVLDDGSRYHYGPPTVGRISGRVVACCSAEQQVEMHLGYEPRENDRADVALLAAEFGLALPPPYAHGD